MQPGETRGTGRLASLDVFRGATIASMMLVNNPGDWGHIYKPLGHAPWHGWTFTDTVFPFFLWIVGVAMTLSTARRVERGDSRIRLLGHVVRRSAIIFLIGLALAGFPYYQLDRIRIPGVLQRIAVCYLLAGTIFLFTKARGQAIAVVLLLGAYTLMMGGNFDAADNFARTVDSRVLAGHMWSQTKVWDPEGIVSTIPAVATTLFGILAGHVLRLGGTPAEHTTWLFAGGFVLIATGQIWTLWMPLNKNLWTASFSVFMAGLAAVVFAIWYWLVDVQGHKRWTRPLAIYGMNAIAVFVLAGLIGKSLGLAKLQQPVYRTLFQPLSADPYITSLLYAICFVLLLYGVAYGMFRKGWFVKF